MSLRGKGCQKRQNNDNEHNKDKNKGIGKSLRKVRRVSCDERERQRREREKRTRSALAINTHDERRLKRKSLRMEMNKVSFVPSDEVKAKKAKGWAWCKAGTLPATTTQHFACKLPIAASFHLFHILTPSSSPLHL